jgi:hypothetical protein
MPKTSYLFSMFSKADRNSTRPCPNILIGWYTAKGSFPAYVYIRVCCVVRGTRASIIDSSNDLIFRNTPFPLVHTNYCIYHSLSTKEKKDIHFVSVQTPLKQHSHRPQQTRPRYATMEQETPQARPRNVLPLQIPHPKFQTARTDGPGCTEYVVC